MKKGVNVLIKSSLIMIGLLICMYVSAQDPGGDPDLPIDKGTVLLIAAGIGYGLIKIRRRNRHRIRNNEGKG